MRSAAVVAALAASASATHYAQGNGTVSYTTEVLTAYTTYCPAATSVVHNGNTYTVTEATTLTISDCPCTVTKPVYTSPVVYCSTCPATSPVVSVETTPTPVVPTTPVATTESPIIPVTSESSTVPATTPAPVVPSGSPAPYPTSSPVYGNSTVPAPTGVAPSGSVPVGSSPAGTATGPNSPAFTGAANKMAASGVSLVGLLGFAAYLL